MPIRLIDCPACGGKVSSAAAFCPHCKHALSVRTNSGSASPPPRPSSCFQQNHFNQGTPKTPADPSTFNYRRDGENRICACGDYPTLFAAAREALARLPGRQTVKADAGRGLIRVIYGGIYTGFTGFVIFYQEGDVLYIETTLNWFNQAKRAEALTDTIESGFYHYKTGQFLPEICENAVPPRSFEKAEMDYVGPAISTMWCGPLLILFVPFGIFLALFFQIYTVVMISRTKAQKGLEYVLIGFFLDIVALVINLILLTILFHL